MEAKLSPEDIAYQHAMKEIFLAPFLAQGDRIGAGHVVDLARNLTRAGGRQEKNCHLRKLTQIMANVCDCRHASPRTFLLAEQAALEQKFKERGAFKPFFKQWLAAKIQEVRALGAEYRY